MGGLTRPDAPLIPDTDTLAWACWHVEQAIRAKGDHHAAS